MYSMYSKKKKTKQNKTKTKTSFYVKLNQSDVLTTNKWAFKKHKYRSRRVCYTHVRGRRSVSS